MGIYRKVPKNSSIYRTILGDFSFIYGCDRFEVESICIEKSSCDGFGTTKKTAC